MCGWMSRWASPGLSDAARQLLAEHPQIDALLVLVDVLAVGVMQHAQQFGLRMPQDIKISTPLRRRASANLRTRMTVVICIWIKSLGWGNLLA